jgi:5-methylcytosine-specific restriction endonuclease McrA
MKQSYSDKLKDPRWQRKRLEIFDRDNFTCKRCGNKDNTLHAHHLYYFEQYPNPWDYPDYALLTLCEDCHTTEHENRRQNEEYLLRILARRGYLEHQIFELAENIEAAGDDLLIVFPAHDRVTG